MNLSSLSDTELITALESLTGSERSVMVSILYHLIELESRGIYRDLGFSSIFDYCTRYLKYSQASAYRRIAAARCLKGNPELGELLLQGKVTLCSVTAAAQAIKKQVTEVSQIVGCSKREVESLVARLEPVAKRPKEIVKPVVVKSDTPLFNIPQEERVQLRFSLSKEDFHRFEEAKARLSSQIGGDLTAEAVVTKLLELFLKPKTRKVKTAESSTRYIPRSIKRAVLERDHNQCCYTTPDGIKCTATKYLQIDHIVPFACGGKTELNNLRLLCPAHNQLMAERHFGREFIQGFSNYHR